ncbi:MAG TPA: YidC/Oxa1 family membrane protein insertase [Candidatus Binatia bacterium]|jgi:YidC/Oxa1 family membrane protein insertase|nr:YidC/Oxa1 family membrane protein insertase [Candidatus Binatia bacterium]
MGQFWHDYLYNPLLNVLFFLYSGPAFGNLGVAVIELTVLLRVALLPFTILEERSRFRYEKLNKKIEAIERDFKTDHVKRAERIRELLKEHKVSYWSKVVVLGVQALVLVLLYQVFIAGIRFTRYEVLYPWVQAPASVNTNFLGFDLADHSALWAGIVAVLLFLQIYTVQKQREHLIRRSDVMYLFLFPVFTLVVLMLLPMVKSLFVLTSMLFSMFIFGARKAAFKVPMPDAD